MLDFEKELEKFEPSLEMEEVEDAIIKNDTSDMMDLLKEIIEENKNRRQTEVE